VRTTGGWKVIDASGMALAYVYRRDDSSAGTQALTPAEARRIAATIAKLPE
jgi:hypothetical protein